MDHHSLAQHRWKHSRLSPWLSWFFLFKESSKKNSKYVTLSLCDSKIILYINNYLVVVSRAANEVLHDYTTTKTINNRWILIKNLQYFPDADSKFRKGADSCRCRFPPKVPILADADSPQKYQFLPMPINRYTPNMSPASKAAADEVRNKRLTLVNITSSKAIKSLDDALTLSATPG